MKNLDWGNLSFGYMKTDYNVRCYYRDGKWGEIEVCSDEYLNLHMAATCLHYGQEAFEGLKAYRCKDGKVRVFRVKDNAERLQSTCRGILMPELPTDLFVEMVKKVVRLNQEWIPTYESGATLYIRPLLIGTSAQVGVHPAKEYCFLIFVTPVGPYFKGGFSTNPYVIIREYDRSAPLGTGKYKVGGNYAASLFANNLRMWCCQLLRHQGQHLRHAKIHLNPSLNHQQESDAGCRRPGHESGTPSYSRRGARNLRGGRCLRHSSSDIAHFIY